MPMTLPLVTSRLTLRFTRPEDLGPLFEIYSDPEVARYLPFGPWNREEAERQLTKRLGRTGLDEAGALSMVIERAGAVVGDLVIWNVGDRWGKAEVGWVIAPAATGWGYATEAAGALLEAAFDQGLHRIVARVDPRNAASIRVCEKLGMTREAYLRRDSWSKGAWTDTVIFGMLAGERP